LPVSDNHSASSLHQVELAPTKLSEP